MVGVSEQGDGDPEGEGEDEGDGEQGAASFHFGEHGLRDRDGQG